MMVKLNCGKEVEIMTLFTVANYPFEYALCTNEIDDENNEIHVLRANNDEDENLLLEEITDINEKDYLNTVVIEMVASWGEENE